MLRGSAQPCVLADGLTSDSQGLQLHVTWFLGSHSGSAEWLLPRRGLGRKVHGPGWSLASGSPQGLCRPLQGRSRGWTLLHLSCARSWTHTCLHTALVSAVHPSPCISCGLGGPVTVPGGGRTVGGCEALERILSFQRLLRRLLGGGTSEARKGPGAGGRPVWGRRLALRTGSWGLGMAGLGAWAVGEVSWECLALGARVCLEVAGRVAFQ